jgi:transcriptional regulator GlxA family with amidase domain
MARVGISPRQHYLNTRIQKVQDLLVSTTRSVKEIADILGFESASHLSKQFKKRIGDSPHDWRVKFAKRGQKKGAKSAPFAVL